MAATPVVAEVGASPAVWLVDTMGWMVAVVQAMAAQVAVQRVAAMVLAASRCLCE